MLTAMLEGSAWYSVSFKEVMNCAWEGCTEEEVCELDLEARGRFHQVPNWENRAWSWEKILCVGIGICKVTLT